MAALTEIDPTLYEACIVDGAGRWKQALHILLNPRAKRRRAYALLLGFPEFLYGLAPLGDSKPPALSPLGASSRL